MDIISREEAAAQELKRYFTGARCRNGHLSPRLVSTKKCVACRQSHPSAAPERVAERNGRYKRPKNAPRRKTVQTEARREANRRWAKANRNKVNALHAQYRARRVQLDPGFAVLKRLRQRVRLALAGASRSASTLSLIGCSQEELVVHIEKQFKEGMGWHNRDEWHVDHIRPCASFNLLDPAQQRECFHFSNLQPLWASENLAKSSKWSPN